MSEVSISYYLPYLNIHHMTSTDGAKNILEDVVKERPKIVEDIKEIKNLSDVQYVTLVQAVGPRFLDAHEIPQRDFNVVTRPFQNNNTQRWKLTRWKGNMHRIQQVSSGRYLDAHEIPSLDFRVVTRPLQDNFTQVWVLYDWGGNFFEIQQASSERYLEAYLDQAKDFQAVTRPRRFGDNVQLWRITGA
jgi:hypothetical protein